MKQRYKTLATTLAATLQLAAIAAVPVAWTNSPGMPPYPINPVPHGSTVDLAVTLKGYTTPPIADGADVRLWYQTNGMGTAWWSAPATFDGSTVTATFGPAQDSGADRVSLFFGAPSNVFASAVLRLTHAPGFTPNPLPLPAPVLDFSAVEVRGLAALTNGWSIGGSSRAESLGTGSYWTDATGCVWRIATEDTPWVQTEGTRGLYFVKWYTEEAVDDMYVCWPGWYIGGSQFYPAYAGDDPHAALICSDSSPVTDEYESEWVVFERVPAGTTNLVGRVALTNDVPEWPVELVHTNTPLIFADGQDTNVTSLALHAQPENYASLSWMRPVSYYLPNRFSLLELGHDYQIAAAQWLQVGRFLYAPSPENIVFVGGGRHRSLQDYLDACSPETMADLLSCYLPTNGGGRIHGDLTVDGRLTVGELVVEGASATTEAGTALKSALSVDHTLSTEGTATLRAAAVSLVSDAGEQDAEVGDETQPTEGWALQRHRVNNGKLKHYDLRNYRTHYFTDANVGEYGIQLNLQSNAHVRIVFEFSQAAPSKVYFDWGYDGGATLLSNGSQLVSPASGVCTLIEVEHLSGSRYLVTEHGMSGTYTTTTFVDEEAGR